MREWLLLGVLALGGILGIWLLIFKSLAALYELWQSGREFERLKRDAASRRMQRPSELMQKQKPVVEDDGSSLPVIPQALLDSLSDDLADPRLVPQKVQPSQGDPGQAADQAPEPPDDLLAAEPKQEQAAAPPATDVVEGSTTSMPPPPMFPLPSADEDSAEDELILDSEPETPPPEEPSEPSAPDDRGQQPPRYDG